MRVPPTASAPAAPKQCSQTFLQWRSRDARRHRAGSVAAYLDTIAISHPVQCKGRTSENDLAAPQRASVERQVLDQPDQASERTLRQRAPRRRAEDGPVL